MFKDFILHKLSLRVLYIIGAYSASHFVSLVASPSAQDVLHKAGVALTVVDPAALKTYITATLLIGGEFVFHFFHEKFVLPHVNQPQGVIKP